MVKRYFPLFLLLLVACSSFAYKYYGIRWAEFSKDVVMLGPDEKKDKPFTDCQDLGNCVVMYRDEFFKFRRDYEEKSIRLKELERRCGNP